MKPKILIYGMGMWSHARVYWDLINNLSNEFNFNFINWTFDGHFNFNDLAKSFDAILIDMNSAQECIGGIFNEETLKKVLPICHGPQQVADYTFKGKTSRLNSYIDRSILFQDTNIFKKILCVSPNTVHAVKKEIPAITPKLILTPLGVDGNNFKQATFVRKSINSLGYFTHYDSTQGQGMDTKRGHLAKRVSELSNIPILMRADIPYQAMDQMYKQIDVYLMTSIFEGAATPLLEAGVCGIPIIAAPAGLAPQFLMNGGGVLAETFDEDEYVKMALNVLTYWKNNPEVLEQESRIIMQNTLENHTWDIVKYKWVNAITDFISVN